MFAYDSSSMEISWNDTDQVISTDHMGIGMEQRDV